MHCNSGSKKFDNESWPGMLLVTFGPILHIGEFSLLNVMVAITDVSNWRDLGLQLGLSSSRLNEIEQQDNPKEKMIIQWMKEDAASWEKLQEALTTPAMCENRVAKGIADRRGSSFDRQSILEIQSKCSTFSGLSNIKPIILSKEKLIIIIIIMLS